MHDDVGPEIDRTAEVPCRAERVVDDKRNPVCVCDLRDSLDIRDIEPRVADRLDIQRPRPLVDKALEIRRRVPLHELHVDPESGKRHLELVICPSVEKARGDDVVPRLENRRDRKELCRLPRRGRQRARAPFQCRDPLLEHSCRRVHDARVDVPELFQAEQVGGMSRVVELVRRRLIDRQRARSRRRVGLLARVELERLESVAAFLSVGAHCALLVCVYVYENSISALNPPGI